MKTSLRSVRFSEQPRPQLRAVSSVVVLRDLRREYAGREVVRGVSLDPPGYGAGMHPQRGKSGHPLGNVGLKNAHVKPLGHVPPHIPWNVTTPQGCSGPVQPHWPLTSGTHARAFAQRPRQAPPLPKQSGMPRVVVV